MRTNWWDARSKSHRDARTLPGAAKPNNWKWRSTGVQPYTHDAGAAAYVAECRRREIEKMHAKEQRAKVAMLQKAVALIPQRATYAYSSVPKVRRLG